MKAWIKEPISKDIPHFDKVLLRLLGEVDKYQMRLPASSFGHAHCMKTTSEALLAIINMDEFDEELLEKLALMTGHHVLLLQDDNQESWSTVYDLTLWRTLTEAVRAITAASGNMALVISPKGVALSQGVKGVVSAMNRLIIGLIILRCAADYPEEMHAKEGRPANYVATPEAAQFFKRASYGYKDWILGLLDQDCPEGVLPPSKLFHVTFEGLSP